MLPGSAPWSFPAHLHKHSSRPLQRSRAAAALSPAPIRALGGCASASTSAPPAHRTARTTAPAATQAPPGPQRFIADVRAAGYGSKDLSTPGVPLVLLDVGKNVCKALSDSQGTNIEGYSTMIESLVKGHGKPSLHQATVLVDSAIRNLCPDNSNLMPSGAP
jgi:hypothetical protein